MVASKQITTNVIFKHLNNSKKKIVVEQGGTRSGKTYNILIWIIGAYLTQNTGKIVTILRKTYPALRATAMRDFLQIMDRFGFLNEKMFNKSTSEIRFNGNLIEFISIDQPQKIRGRKRNLLFINEANELSIEDWRQLTFRTTERIILDYNPSMEFHWIYDQVITRDDCDFFKTTYRNNPFLEPELVKEIERLKDTDPWYWSVYGMGEPMASLELIYRHEVVDSEPKDAEGNTIAPEVYGLDFGYSNHETALVAIWRYKDGYLVSEKIYEKGMGNHAIAERMKELGLNRNSIVYADSAEPKSIDEIYGYGINIRAATKGPDSVRAGISFLQQAKLYVTKDSSGLLKEFRNYKWKQDKEGRNLNEPVKMFDHAMDAMRYGIYSQWGRSGYGTYYIR